MHPSCAIFAAIVDRPDFPQRGQVALSAPAGAADAYLAAALAMRSRGLVLAVVPGIPDADRLLGDLQTLKAGDAEFSVWEFPAADGDGDRLSGGLRLKTAAAIRERPVRSAPAVVVAPAAALALKLPRRGSTPLPLAPADGKSATVTQAGLRDFLAAGGYRRVPRVEGEGDWSWRGSIVDCWPPGEEWPLRAEFFGDELESLRTFDPATQLSVAAVPAAAVAACRGESGDDGVTLPELAGDDAVMLFIDHNAYPIGDDLRCRLPLTVYTGDPPPAATPTATLETSPLPGFAELGAGDAHHPELFESARARLSRHLEAARRRGVKICRVDALSAGFETSGMIVTAKADRVFTRRTVRSRHPERAYGARLNDFDELEPGEYVVHLEHGVGRYLGSSEIMLDGRRAEVFTIEYAEGARLHVPATHAHLLSRYVGVRGIEPQLHALDGKRWRKDRADAEKSLADLAASLLETQARREALPGYRYDVHCEGLDAFEAAFPFAETPDQLAAIAAVKKDMASSRPMDRLVCGDAGYGKTEVAMRAAYIAALNGRQTVLLAPTTVLAEQHFETFTARFDGTPVRIESVSRFQSQSVHRGTFARLLNGACDIAIGTHALLTDRIAFKDLGLVIIDEEQRFGVRQKEFLKRLRATADVLTLSATPIPRTLYLSMTGARDLSVLRTPPRERTAVDTVVQRDSDSVIAAAVAAELARGGQVFFIHNRVAGLARAEERLRAICPGCRIVVAHGQLDSSELAVRMRAFQRGKFDLLLCTTIVEAGVDIPRANTIIVDDAHTFGLADLYQLRGRVGRSSVCGRAILLLPPSGIVDAEARARLDALKRHSQLGAGFNLAVRDLELRGAGNLLGEKQSGHIAAVGFTLYCQLLQRAVARLKGEAPPAIVEVQMNLDFLESSPDGDSASAAALPYTYIDDDAERMLVMKRLAECVSPARLAALRRETTDRFGRLPDAARRLFDATQLRLTLAEHRWTRLNVSGRRAVFTDSRGGAYVCELPDGDSADRRLAELRRAARTLAAK